MSEATRAVALAEASKLNLKSADDVLSVAARYNSWLEGADAAAKPATATKAATGGGAASAKKPSKSEEEVVKAALEKQRAEAETEENPEDAEPAEEASEDDLPATQEGVAAGIARLLKANKRKEAIATLKKFGATSASSVKAKDYVKFIAEVKKLLPDEGGESDDLTA